MNSFLDSIDIEKIKDIAVQAGIEILKIYETDFDVEYKEDNSPITKADKVANAIICSKLTQLYPSIPLLSEENQEIDYEVRKNWDYYWCIDPLDGTREFIKKNGEFTVNIALIYKNNPVLGIVYAPFFRKLYFAKKNNGAYLEIFDGQCKKVAKHNLPYIVKNDDSLIKVVISRSRFSNETKEYITKLEKEYDKVDIIRVGSSLKLCMVADGSTDMVLSFNKTMEWDIAASHLIILEMGKSLNFLEQNKKIIYNNKTLFNSSFLSN